MNGVAIIVLIIILVILWEVIARAARKKKVDNFVAFAEKKINVESIQLLESYEYVKKYFLDEGFNFYDDDDIANDNKFDHQSKQFVLKFEKSKVFEWSKSKGKIDEQKLRELRISSLEVCNEHENMLYLRLNIIVNIIGKYVMNLKEKDFHFLFFYEVEVENHLIKTVIRNLGGNAWDLQKFSNFGNNSYFIEQDIQNSRIPYSKFKKINFQEIEQKRDNLLDFYRSIFEDFITGQLDKEGFKRHLKIIDN
jgi:hypothetical protein